MAWTLPVILCTIGATVVAYLLGSCNFAIIITKLFANDDIRNHGSGNAGLTNVLRTLGKGPALLTLIGDFSKGILSVILVRLLLHYIAGVNDFYVADYIVAIAALLGHNFPLYYGFRGGKGILVSFGAVMILSPIAGTICFIGFLLAVIFTKYVSFGSIVACILFPITTQLFYYLKTSTFSLTQLILALCISALIIFMHRSNISRLLHGKESKLSFKRK
ncbi:glycerol-3-phosphate 1-O-acyltransferase PlsY [Paludicola sp. MB14-C6]|uniref:glycerol-3-phosphate 1-O-acyltransferase PlsY n=1 Tax=Paludihabitans sp. MB14-C6 TaxID=3070656 RepID=UPI0027DE6E61|nr:glycerol-3-phosphate 1-O-acyltransferase PlsY [Paludicola sp. MB14-C6]WMJ22798.1 glycerol-3-phosphate 1-O-acyltransferase PlsY [Paludicola sp. MB14-C6]